MKNSITPHLRGIVITILLLILIPFETANYSDAVTQKPKLPKPSCRIEVDDAHISSSIQKHRGINVVKVNARSICNVRQDQVTLTLEIYKVELLSDHFLDRVMTDPLSPKSSGSIIKIQDAKVVCINTQPSSFYGIAFAKAFIQGKWQYAGKTRSAKIRDLKCGT
jgi:hypothetical protein